MTNKKDFVRVFCKLLILCRKCRWYIRRRSMRKLRKKGVGLKFNSSSLKRALKS